MRSPDATSPHVHRAMPASLNVQPPGWQRRAVHLSVLALVLTGVAWLVPHYLMGSAGDLGASLPHPAERWALRLHGISAYAFLLVLGSIAGSHSVAAWRLRRHRTSGSLLLGTALLLAMTALVLYYGSESVHSVTSALHWGVGLLMLPLLWLHVLIARRERRPQR